jgi:hypothetical protein
MEKLQQAEIEEVLRDCNQLRNSLTNLKETILKMEENNTQIETANPYVSSIDEIIHTLIMFKSEFEEIV